MPAEQVHIPKLTLFSNWNSLIWPLPSRSLTAVAHLLIANPATFSLGSLEDAVIATPSILSSSILAGAVFAIRIP
jgi:hypothetical protein